METNNTFKSETRYYQSQTRDFTPITVSADFAALEYLKLVDHTPERNEMLIRQNMDIFTRGVLK
jgi:hypothetical protein